MCVGVHVCGCVWWYIHMLIISSSCGSVVLSRCTILTIQNMPCTCMFCHPTFTLHKHHSHTQPPNPPHQTPPQPQDKVVSLTASKTELEAQAHEAHIAKSDATAAALRHQQETQSLQAHIQWLQEEATRKQEQQQQQQSALHRQVLESQSQVQQLQLSLAKSEQACQAAQAEADKYKRADAVCREWDCVGGGVVGVCYCMWGFVIVCGGSARGFCVDGRGGCFL